MGQGRDMRKSCLQPSSRRDWQQTRWDEELPERMGVGHSRPIKALVEQMGDKIACEENKIWGKG